MLVSVCLTLLPQFYLDESIFRMLMYLSWGAVALIIVSLGWPDIRTSQYGKVYLLMYGCVALVCILNGLLGKEHLNSYYLYMLIIPLVSYHVGYWMRQWLSDASLRSLITFYCVAVCLFGIVIGILNVPSFTQWAAEQVYTYNAKNPVAQLLGVATLCALASIHKKDPLARKLLFATLTLAMVTVIAFLRSRTPLLAVIVATVIYSILLTRRKYLWWAAATLIAVALLNSKILWFLDRVFLFTKYQGLGLDALSSGRLSLYQTAMADFAQRPFFGGGHYYVDNMYLCVLSELGLIGAGLIYPIWLYRIVLNVRTFTRNRSPLATMVLLITVYYFVVSFLEAFPPFGPGAASFFFWLLCGMMGRRAREGTKMYALEP